MQKRAIFSITSALVLGVMIMVLATPLIVSAIPSAAEPCCKVGAEVKWKGILGIIPDCSTHPPDNYCTIDEGETIGPKSGTSCSLLNSTGGTGPVELNSPDWAMICLLGTIGKVTNWIFFLMMAGAVLVIVYGGFLYITAAGDPSKAGKGKTALTLAIIGIAIALIARLVPSAVRFIMGM